ncbi:hypothetical protein NDK47_14470 [Brevibacillus ruminantium]|uniref:Diacylglyceryl transferase n=1 Tax=Brevibacillus ruminantium TaxID=2950604 RepID=A0ABY4WFF3_9BACL|nr:hypothetical protein [Brevibacillus ruminantium]USG63386.1 hypothetical protein NDK47_14470 [Brevibacillus ruminantium]
MLEPGSTLSVGPLQLPVQLLTFAVAVLLFSFWIKRVDSEKESVSAFLQAGGNALVVALLVYKLWPVLEAGTDLLVNPTRLLFYNGGAYGLEAAAVAGTLMFLAQGIRGKWLDLKTIEWLLALCAFLGAAYSVLVKGYGPAVEAWGWEQDGRHYLPLNLWEALLMLSVLMILSFPRMRQKASTRERVGVLLLGLGLWVILHFTLSVGETGVTGWMSYREEAGLAAVYLGAWLVLKKRTVSA